MTGVSVVSVAARMAAENVALEQAFAIQRAAEAEDPVRAPAVDSFQNFGAQLGMGTDNLMAQSTYGFNPITRIRTLLEWIHRGSWLGGVAVDIYADDMTRAGVDILGVTAPDDMEAIEEEATALSLWPRLNETIKWSRLYGGAIAVFLIEGQNYDTPLRVERIDEGAFRGLVVFDRWMIEPSLNDLVNDPGPDLGLPKFYTVTTDAPAMRGFKVHHSRCIRLEGVPLPYWQRVMENLWGTSVFERLYDRMVAFDSATTGAAQLVYKAYLRTYAIDGLREVISAGGKAMTGLVKYVDMMRRFQSIEGITLLDAKDKMEAMQQPTFTGISDALTQFGQQLSGALQIPLVRLFGQSPAGFSTGDTDLKLYYDTILQQQQSRLKVGVTKAYRLIGISKRIDVPKGFGVRFRSLWQLTEKEKADIAKVTSDAVLAPLEMGVISPQVAAKELRQSAQHTGVFSNITDEDINALSDEAEPPVPESVDPDTGLPAAGGEPGAPQIPGAEPGSPQAAGTADVGGDWEESKHPRAENGQFGSGGGGAGGASSGGKPAPAAAAAKPKEPASKTPVAKAAPAAGKEPASSGSASAPAAVAKPSPLPPVPPAPAAEPGKPAPKTYIGPDGFERSYGLNEHERRVEEDFYDAIKADTKGMIDKYLSDTTTIDADKIKKMSPAFAKDPGLAAAVHEPSSYLSKLVWTEALKRNKADGSPPVVFTAGGGGSGKSEAAKVAHAVTGRGGEGGYCFDSTLSSFKSAKKKIDETLASGAPAAITYTNCPVEKAFAFAMGRQRVVPIYVLAEAHIGASNTLRELTEHYKAEKRVNIDVVNNFGSLKDIHVGTIADVPKYDYNEVKGKLHALAKEARARAPAIEAHFEAVKAAHAQGKASKEAYDAAEKAYEQRVTEAKYAILLKEPDA